MLISDSQNGAHEPRLSLLFFAPERDRVEILDAYDLYLHHLVQSGRFDITIMAPNGSAFGRKAQIQGHRIHPISDFARKLLQRTPQLWPILTATRRYRFDVALAHDAYGCRGLSQIARCVIGISHDDRFEGFKPANRVIALTSGALDLAQESLGEETPVDVLPYPFVCNHIRPVPLPKDHKSPLTIGASGPFKDGDGLGMFIHAAQLLHEGEPELQFVIAGNGPMEHELKELADKIAPFIDFVGPMTPDEMAQRFDLYCLPAAVAPYSLALCQMMDAGVACIATCASGPMDILKGGMVAPLVPIGDAFMLAVQLQELVEDRSHIERIKSACFERIREEDFDARVFEKRLVGLITEIYQAQMASA